MIGDTFGKTESVKNDPGELARVLELELIQKRAAWQRANTRYCTIRTISVVFLFVVIAASIAAFFLVFPRANEVHSNPQDTTQAIAPKP
jgi:hypothetical protein